MVMIAIHVNMTSATVQLQWLWVVYCEVTLRSRVLEYPLTQHRSSASCWLSVTREDVIWQHRLQAHHD